MEQTVGMLGGRGPGLAGNHSLQVAIWQSV